MLNNSNGDWLPIKKSCGVIQNGGLILTNVLTSARLFDVGVSLGVEARAVEIVLAGTCSI